MCMKSCKGSEISVGSVRCRESVAIETLLSAVKGSSSGVGFLLKAGRGSANVFCVPQRHMNE